MDAVPTSGHFYLSPRSKLAYLAVPKSGCTSFINMMHKAEDPTFSPIGTRVHREPRLERIPASQCPAGFFPFSVVRNPYGRLLSFYNSKVRKMADPDPHVNHTLRAMGIEEAMPFRDMLDVLERTSTMDMDLHCRPQYLFLEHYGELQVQLIGKLEESSRFLDDLASQTGVVLEMAHENTATSFETPAIYAEKKLRDRVYALYQRDYEKFGYPRAVAQFT